MKHSTRFMKSATVAGMRRRSVAVTLPQAWLIDLAAETGELVRELMQLLVQQLTPRSLLAGVGNDAGDHPA